VSTVNARGQVLTDLLGVSLTLYRETDGLGRITWTKDAIGGQTRYWFDGDGNALALEDANNAITSATYNAVGQRTTVSDPNMGVWVNRSWFPGHARGRNSRRHSL
jgi:YD repeat-containing protein